jgi:predicted amino acid dehydrogenase
MSMKNKLNLKVDTNVKNKGAVRFYGGGLGFKPFEMRHSTGLYEKKRSFFCMAELTFCP